METSWDRIFEGMYEAYEKCLSSVPVEAHSAFGVANT
jgi:hypothetical protein